MPYLKGNYLIIQKLYCTTTVEQVNIARECAYYRVVMCLRWLLNGLMVNIGCV